MAADFEVLGWADYDGDPHKGEPDSLSDTYGLLVHATNKETGDDIYFWSRMPQPFDTWDEWYDYVMLQIEDYGIPVG